MFFFIIAPIPRFEKLNEVTDEAQMARTSQFLPENLTLQLFSVLRVC